MSRWPTVELGRVIRHRSEFIQIDDLKVYNRPRVQLHAQGVVLRDEVPGALIKTKKQQVCRAGELLVAEIDAKVGGFGLVPPDLDGAIVSSHYFLFEVDPSHLDRRFLDWFIRTLGFREQVAAQGSTNYAAIRPGHVLGYKIPLPPLEEQRRLVARIDEVAGELLKLRSLRAQIAMDAETLIVSVHHSLAAGRMTMLSELMSLHEEPAVIQSTGSYPQIGVRGFGGGLFPKTAVSGVDTTYRQFNRLFAGAIVLSQVKGWEGAVAVCPTELDGWFASPEYRTFRCVTGRAEPKYIDAVIRTKWFCSKLAEATRGVGARRERTRPEQFLKIKIPMPNYEAQLRGIELFNSVGALKRLQSENAAALDALLPAVLDRAFKGEL